MTNISGWQIFSTEFNGGPPRLRCMTIQYQISSSSLPYANHSQEWHYIRCFTNMIASEGAHIFTVYPGLEATPGGCLFWRSVDITNGRNIDLLVGESDSESQWQVWDSDQQTFSHQNPWVNLPTSSPRVHFDRCFSVACGGGGVPQKILFDRCI